MRAGVVVVEKVLQCNLLYLDIIESLTNFVGLFPTKILLAGGGHSPLFRK